MNPGGYESADAFALVLLGELRLLLRRRELRALEPASEARAGRHPEAATAAPGAWGSITTPAGTWPVYCVSERLEPLEDPPAPRHMCAVLDLAEGGMGLLCDEVHTLEESALRFFPVPGCMRVPGFVVESVAVHASNVACLVSAAALAAAVSCGAAPQERN